MSGFETTTVMIGDRTMRVALADTPDLRARGLMEVEDLGNLEGMVFVMGRTTTSAFTMRNTRIPLHIAFFDADGMLVDVLEMKPCEAEPCPRYRPVGPFSHAVEAPLGAFDDLDAGDRFSIKG